MSRTHTFETGRVAELRDSVPLHVLMRRATAAGEDQLINRLQEMSEGELTDPAAALRMQDILVTTMWIAPRVVPPEDWELMDNPPDGVISIDELTDTELAETLELALQEVKAATGFRPNKPRVGSGKGRKGVGSKAKPTPRPE